MKIRSSVFWLIAIVTVLIAVVLWLGRKRPEESPAVASSAAPAAATVPDTSASASVHTNAPPAQVASTSEPATASQPPQDKVAMLKEVLQANDADVVLYGLLEDQFGNALGDVPINFEIRYEDANGKGVQKGQVTSDANGLFTISGYKGEMLSFIPEKPGYVLTSHNNGGVYSPEWPEAQRVHPDPNHPVVIKMWKLKGGEHLIHFYTVAQVPLDGTAIAFDLQTGRQVESGGDIVISVKSSPTPSVRQEYDWQVTIHAVNGGLIPSSADFGQMFQAPDSGFDPQFDVNYQKGTRSWTSRFTDGFYFTSRNGGSYGKLGIEVLSDIAKNGTVPVILNSYVNPAGSQNLETDSAKITEARP